MKKIILLVALLGLVSCDSIKRIVTPDDVKPADSVSYRVIGTSIIGVVLIDYSTPSSGVVSVTSNLANPFVSGQIGGYSQFITTHPALTVSLIATGCAEGQILINAVVVETKSGCGPVTFSIKH